MRIGFAAVLVAAALAVAPRHVQAYSVLSHEANVRSPGYFQRSIRKRRKFRGEGFVPHVKMRLMVQRMPENEIDVVW